MATPEELPINTNASAMAMAREIFGDGVTVVRASYTGDNRSSGIYSDGDDVSPEVTPGDTGVILSTGHVADFTNAPGGWWWNQTEANENPDTSTDSSGVNNNAQFNAAAGTNTYDASWLDVDFIPSGNMMTMQFVFSSEEYPEYAVGAYQDFVGVWVNGTQVNLTVGDGDIDPNNLNAGSNGNLFIDNTGDQYNTEMDGFTVTMTLSIPVIDGQVNSIRIGIADVTDSSYDSNLLIAGGSVQTVLVAETDSATLYPDGTTDIDVLDNDVNNTGGSLTVTHINGQPVVTGSTVTLNSGQQVTLNGDGTLTVIGDGDTETVNFTYTVESSTGQTDTGFVTVDSIPCFVAGTLIRTPTGDVPVDWLQPGDPVMTRDEGPQPLRWIGRRKVAAIGAFAPICIRAGTFGPHHELWVSPEHRILIRDSLAELLFGEAEVLVAAKHLVNDATVRRIETGEVEYFHLMFDRHQVVFSEGLETESFLPGPQTAQSFAPDTLAEICALFPELDPETGEGYSPAARRTLRGFEAQLWLAGRRAA
ncbi:Hint domain-containing protein [Lutimaribacter pacificus]|uniref:Hint domain-containing protein n=1 Tax=Lutimaribacter pacificus TaxID=391948 RepID=A0A1H0GD09_9RHOB|nr:Hint domain-containing protein [Lutimaribacter pacificus]SDO04762.1 Hint domain-containing protein [Lutimaribacter pacificus]SHJ87058.1 Hint domain-containing protein [Lutimaribacter pacificus]